MNLNALKLFRDLVRERSFSRAAALNGITQSAASQVVTQLERRLGVKLIDRSRRPWGLTAEGQAYHDGIVELVDRYFAVEAQVRSLHEKIVSTVRVAAIYSVGLLDMTRYTRRFSELEPAAQIHIDYRHPDQVAEAVLRQEADLGLLSFPRAARELHAIPWRQEEMVVACHPQHRFAGKPKLPVARLGGEQFIAFERGLAIRREIDRYLRRHEVIVDVAMEFDNVESIKHAVEIGAGISILPAPTLQDKILAGTLAFARLDPGELVRPLAIIHRHSKPLNLLEQRFVTLLREEPVPGDPVRPVSARTFKTPER
jgi:DNA-binding transcriptional LysR family regulator